MSKHTPGNWTMRESNFAFHVYGEFKKSKNAFITAAYWSNPEYGASREEAAANARLIAAAPDLLTACEVSVYHLEAHLGASNPAVVAMRAAIAKATGESK